MKRLTLLLFLWLGCTIAMTVTAGIVGLSINKESGIYEKGERAVVTCHTDIAPADSLLVSVSNVQHPTGIYRFYRLGAVVGQHLRCLCRGEGLSGCICQHRLCGGS